MNNTVRKPVQTRSIETKNKIINSSLELFSTVGYYKTNTAQIAKNANVSTGIVYGYFKDKRDILLSVLEMYIEEVSKPILDIIKNAKKPINLDLLIEQTLEGVIKIHKQNAPLHQVLHSMTTNDDVVNQKFIELEDNLSKEIFSTLNDLGIITENLPEKIHLAMNIIQSFSHEYIYDKHSYLDYTNMKKIVLNTVKNLFLN